MGFRVSGYRAAGSRGCLRGLGFEGCRVDGVKVSGDQTLNRGQRHPAASTAMRLSTMIRRLMEYSRDPR